MVPARSSQKIRGKKQTSDAHRQPATQSSKQRVRKAQSAQKKSQKAKNVRNVAPSRTHEVVDDRRQSNRAAETDDSDDEFFPDPPKASDFVYLKAQTKHVSQDQVVNDWKAMPELAQQRLADVLVAAKRGVVNTAKSAKKAEEMSSTVEPLLRRIVSRLPRMLAPPKTKDINFDLEKLLERSRSLEAQLTASLHSIELLKAEINREEANLENDEEKLAEMEQNTKAEEALWRKQAKRANDSIELPDNLDMLDDRPDEIGYVYEDEEMLESLFDDSDPDLAPVLAQLRNHLDSISSNGLQLKGVVGALDDSSLALEAIVNR